jgi:hypothetical protein
LLNLFDELQLKIIALDREWASEPERAGLRHTAADIRHHVCAAVAALERVDNHVPCTRTFDQLDGFTRVLSHEAFLSVLALGQLLRRALEDGLATPSVVEVTQLAVTHLLDELRPYVSNADAALRRVLLEDMPLEEALAGVARAP